jgi:NTE family protein
VWQSATIPIVWEPVGDEAWVDGGLRNVTPLGDALDYNPSEIVVIVTGRPDLPEVAYPRHIVDVAKRSLLDITLNEIMLNDVSEFVRINRLVKQAQEAGVELTRSDGGRYRYVPITLIEPAERLGNTLDFSPEAIGAYMQAGEDAARRSLGS